MVNPDLIRISAYFASLDYEFICLQVLEALRSFFSEFRDLHLYDGLNPKELSTNENNLLV